MTAVSMTSPRKFVRIAPCSRIISKVVPMLICIIYVLHKTPRNDIANYYITRAVRCLKYVVLSSLYIHNGNVPGYKLVMFNEKPHREEKVDNNKMGTC